MAAGAAIGKTPETRSLDPPIEGDSNFERILAKRPYRVYIRSPKIPLRFIDVKYVTPLLPPSSPFASTNFIKIHRTEIHIHIHTL